MTETVCMLACLLYQKMRERAFAGRLRPLAPDFPIICGKRGKNKKRLRERKGIE